MNVTKMKFEERNMDLRPKIFCHKTRQECYQIGSPPVINDWTVVHSDGEYYSEVCTCF